MADAAPSTHLPTPDQRVRRARNLLSQFDALKADTAAELAKLEQARRTRIAEVESQARAEVRNAVESRAKGIEERVRVSQTLAAELKAMGAARPATSSRPVVPGSYRDVIDEWGAAERRVRGEINSLTARYREWEQRRFKRASSAPVPSSKVWQDLERLDALSDAFPERRQAYVAGRVREVAQAIDLDLKNLIDRQREREASLTRELTTATDELERSTELAARRWQDLAWANAAPATTTQGLLRLGDLASEHDGAPCSVPALLPFPLQNALVVEASGDLRSVGADVVRNTMVRLLAAAPPGQMRLHVVDPVAVGQSVADFRHLHDFDEQIVDDKTWTSEPEIDRLLDELVQHLEVVISKYLRGQYPTIEAYNRDAGELAEPLRSLVVFDYPYGFSDRSVQNLLTIMENGPRCGVFTVLHIDTERLLDGHRRPVPADRLTQKADRVLLRERGHRLASPSSEGRADEAVFIPDMPVPIEFDSDGTPTTPYAQLLVALGQATRTERDRPQVVTLASLLPVLQRTETGVAPAYIDGCDPLSLSPGTWWSASTTDRAVALLGRSGARGVTSMWFSSTEIAGGAIMVGLPRSGKTTSLHSMILTMSMLYDPSELELYLIDAKHGVEFKIYESLPHARMVSTHSEREFSLAVLQSLEAEVRRRAELMKATAAGRANLSEYRRATGEVLPRVVMIIDEFHELFEEADSIGQEAFAAFSNLVRMGPFAGVHLVVASQTLSSMPAMDRQTLTLLPQRVAFMCNEYDAEIVLGDFNKGTRSLSKTGEGLFNPARGDEAKNEPFQGLLIEHDQRAVILEELRSKADERGLLRHPRVFDGDRTVPRPQVSTPRSTRFTIPIGEPFSLEAQENVTLRRTRSGNMVVLTGGEDASGGLERTALAALQSVLVAAKNQAEAVTIVDFIGDASDGDLPVDEVARTLGFAYTRSTGLAGAVEQEATHAAQRVADGDYSASARMLILYGLERALSLVPYDPYAEHDPLAPDFSGSLASTIQVGPEVGVHVVVSADRLSSLDRRIGSELQQEFAVRIGGPGADSADLGLLAAQFGTPVALRPGQLLLSDGLRGTSKRVRGYEPVRSTQQLAELIAEEPE